jgi:hypothetical protein
VGNGWNWDEPSRWWGQIAGDCVDLNTENPAVTNYLVKCYEQFIKMGVDGFRIDTSGHISRLTFNKAFIPQFTALGQQYASAVPCTAARPAARLLYVWRGVRPLRRRDLPRPAQPLTLLLYVGLQLLPARAVEQRCLVVGQPDRERGCRPTG